MGRIDKFLKRLTLEEREGIISCLEDILSGNFERLDVKKLRGQKYFYRVRLGDIRIIFTKQKDGIRVIAIERRNDNTYRGY